MVQWLKNILELQEVDLKIRNLNIRLNMIPREVKILNDELQVLEKKLHTEKEILQKTELDIKNIESEVELRNQKISKLQQQSLQVKKNEEYTALQHEMTHLNDEIGDFETREIEALDILENAQVAFKQFGKDLKISQKTIKADLDELHELEDSINAQIAEKTETRNALASKVDEDYLSRYDRILRKNDGNPVSKIHDKICGHCSLSLMPQTVTTAKKEQFVLCEHCNYIIYI